MISVTCLIEFFGNKYIMFLVTSAVLFFMFCSSENDPNLATLCQTMATQSGRKLSGTASTLALEAQELIQTVRAIIEVDCK